MARFLITAVFAGIGLLLLTPVVLLALPFWLIAGGTRLVHDGLMTLKPRVAPWQQLIEYCPEIGWKPKPNMSTYAYADKPYRVATDQDGWRGRASVEASELVVFGDSYAFGYGVSDGDHFAELSRRIKIKAIGVNGYNMVQTLLWMQALAPKLRGKLVVWFIYHGNDLFENLQPNLDKYRMPFVRRADKSGAWEILTAHVSDEPWDGDRDRDYYAALAAICTPTTTLSQRAFSACEFLIRQAHTLCAQIGARLAVISIPDITQISETHMQKLSAVAPDPGYFDPTLPDTRLRAMCKALGIDFIPLREHLKIEDHKLHDAHWNERGHRRVARLLEELHAGGTRTAEVSPAGELGAPSAQPGVAHPVRAG